MSESALPPMAQDTAPLKLDFDPDVLRTRYRQERDQRLRSDGNDQYREVAGDFSHYIDDPYVEPGFTRAGAALRRAYPGMPTPIYRFMFSDAFAWGFPPEPYALDAHLRLTTDCDPGAPTLIAGLGVDLRKLIPHAVAQGVHVRAGLEDAPFGTDKSNVQLVEEASGYVVRAGGTIASVDDVRAALAAHSGARHQPAGRAGATQA